MKSLAEELLNYYRSHREDFADDLENLDDLNGCLGHERCRFMDEFFDLFWYADSPKKLFKQACNGHNENGNRSFDPDAEYFYTDEKGQLVSTNIRYYGNFLDEAHMQEIIDHEYDLYLSAGAQKMIDNYRKEYDGNGKCDCSEEPSNYWNGRYNMSEVLEAGDDLIAEWTAAIQRLTKQALESSVDGLKFEVYGTDNGRLNLDVNGEKFISNGESEEEISYTISDVREGFNIGQKYAKGHKGENNALEG